MARRRKIEENLQQRGSITVFVLALNTPVLVAGASNNRRTIAFQMAGGGEIDLHNARQTGRVGIPLQSNPTSWIFRCEDFGGLVRGSWWAINTFSAGSILAVIESFDD